MKHDYFSSFNQLDHCFLALWSLLKRPICQRLRVLSSEGNIALLSLQLTRQGGAKKEKLLFAVTIVSHVTFTSSVCYKSGFNQLKLHVIELDKVKEFINQSFLWTFLLQMGSF